MASRAADLKRYGGWALITGASSGLGREFARQIAAQGVDCALLGLEEEKLAETASELTARHGVACRTVALDLADDDAAARAAEAVADIPIGILVNCAGMTHGGPFMTRDPARLAQVAKANAVAPVLLTRTFLPAMAERGAGAIVIVSSVQAYISCPYEAVYCGSKAFLLHFGEALWGELRGTPIDCVTVCPGGMRTNLFHAAGYTEADCARMWRVSSEPAAVAALALRRLGKGPVAEPFMTQLSALVVRVLPRRWMIAIVHAVSQRLIDYRAL